MSRSLRPTLGLLSLLAVIAGCGITRTETDYYTITIRDTTYREDIRNVPGSSDDHGVVYPSSKTTQISRHTLTYDSTFDRRYPNFLRIGGLEFAGLVGTSSRAGIGPGLFGVYSLLDSTTINEIGSALNPMPTDKEKTSKFFKGSIVRFFPLEYRLRWFEDSPNWTIGINLFEWINKDEEQGFSSVLSNVYLRKRYFFRDKIPYVIAAPYFGLSMWPSMYINMGGELIVGSYGGFNVRGYAGLATGFNWKFGNQEGSKSFGFPYIGLGVSAMDFLNKPEETERVWEEYVHSAIEITALDLSLLAPFEDYVNAFDTSIARLPFKGGTARLATSHFPLPFLDGKFWAGTSLFQYMALGFEQATFSVLPLRVGYRQHLIAEDLSIEPYVELNYYPSFYLNLATRLRLNTFSGVNFGFVFGYASGSSGAFLPNTFVQEGSPIGSDFSSVYAGVVIGLSSTLYTPEFVRASRASER